MSPFIAQSFLYGDSLKNACVAVIFPEKDAVMKWAASKPDLAEQSFEDLCCSSPELRELLKTEMA